MPRLRCEALLPFSDAQMFALVRDVERYPEFIPGCEAVSIEAPAAQAGAAGPERVSVALCVQVPPRLTWRDRVSTENRYDSPSGIAMKLVSGGMNQLRGQWSFSPLGDSGCRVTLSLEFEFQLATLNAATAPLMDRFGDRVLKIFEQRARTVYGG